MRAVVIGATAGVGRALSEVLACKGAALLLVASDARDLNVIAAHLTLVHKVEVITLAANAADEEDFVNLVCDGVRKFGSINALFFPMGVSNNLDKGYLSLQSNHTIFSVNTLSIIGIITSLLPALQQQPKARIVGFSSVAAVRGRRSNIVYSAAKRSLESYFESLRHLTVGSGAVVQIYRLGYVATQQSFGKRLIFPVVTPQQVAEVVVKNIDRDIGRVYFPRFWALISFVVESLPWSIYKKLDF